MPVLTLPSSFSSPSALRLLLKPRRWFRWNRARPSSCAGRGSVTARARSAYGSACSTALRAASSAGIRPQATNAFIRTEPAADSDRAAAASNAPAAGRRPMIPVIWDRGHRGKSARPCVGSRRAARRHSDRSGKSRCCWSRDPRIGGSEGVWTRRLSSLRVASGRSGVRLMGDKVSDRIYEKSIPKVPLTVLTCGRGRASLIVE